MSSRSVDAMLTAWQPDPSGLWAVTAGAHAARFRGGRGLHVVADAGAPGDPQPFAERSYPAPVDLTGDEELRVWLRSSRAGDGGPRRPRYLSLEADTNPPSGAAWRRDIGVGAAHRWELLRLWVGDMDPAVRGGVETLRLRSLDASVAFTADVSELLAVAPEAITDVDAALLARLHNRFTVPASGGGTTAVPAFIDVHGTSPTRSTPFIRISALAVTPIGSRGGAGEVVDNDVATRPAPSAVRLDFAVEVFAATRAQIASLLDALVLDLREPLVVAGVPHVLDFFERPGDPARTPLFIRLVAAVDPGRREIHDLARPFLLIGHVDDRPGAETVPV